MKAEELMTCDFCVVNKDVCLNKGTIVKVLGVDSENTLKQKGLVGSVSCIDVTDPDEFRYGVWCEYLNPIPLTPEILEKNGFKMVLDINKLPTYRIKWTRNPNLYFTIFTGVDGYWNPVGFGVTIGGVSGEVGYVHQLQHALRLCRIDKEIVL